MSFCLCGTFIAENGQSRHFDRIPGNRPMNSLQQRDSRRLPLSFDVLEDRSTPALISISLVSTPLADNFVRPTAPGVSADAIRDAFGPGALTDDLTQPGPNGQTPEQAQADGTNGSNNGQPTNRPAPSPAGEVRTPAEEETA